MFEYIVMIGDEIVIEVGDVVLVIVKFYFVLKYIFYVFFCEGKCVVYVM